MEGRNFQLQRGQVTLRLPVWFLFRAKFNSMFIFWKVIFEKLFFKFLCIYLPLKKLVNENIFRSIENTFQSKKNLVWFPEKYFSFWLCLFSGKWFSRNTFQTFLCLFAIRKVGQRKTLSSKRNIWLGFQESVFLENLGEKHFPEVVKNLEISLFANYIKFDPQTFNYYI